MAQPLFKIEGNTVYILNDNDHNIMSFTVQPGCKCPRCTEKATDDEIAQWADRIAFVLNEHF